MAGRVFCNLAHDCCHVRFPNRKVLMLRYLPLRSNVYIVCPIVNRDMYKQLILNHVICIITGMGGK